MNADASTAEQAVHTTVATLKDTFQNGVTEAQLTRAKYERVVSSFLALYYVDVLLGFCIVFSLSFLKRGVGCLQLADIFV